MKNNFIYYTNCISNDKIITQEEAKNYLQYLLRDDFLYNNICNYDIIDYEKIIFIEQIFKENQDIQLLINNLKENIATGYQFKKKYKQRIFDNYNTNELLNFDKKNERYFFGLPKK